MLILIKLTRTLKTENTLLQRHYKIMREKLSLSKSKECERRFAVRSSFRFVGSEQVQIVGIDKRRFLAEFYSSLEFLFLLFQDKRKRKASLKFLVA